MSMRDWLCESEGYHFRMERLYADLDEMVAENDIVDLQSETGQRYHRRMLAWMQAAYDAGVEQGKKNSE